MRDDAPFGGPDPGGGVLLFLRPLGTHPEQHLFNAMRVLMQADAYAGSTGSTRFPRKPGPIPRLACWAHARRKFFDLARLNKRRSRSKAVKRGLMRSSRSSARSTDCGEARA